MWGWVAAAGVAAALGAAPRIAERRRLPVSALRETAEGRLLRLPGGTTHCRVLGAPRGPVALCLHGLTLAGDVWLPLAAHLSRQGFRVVLPDLYGHGLSDRVPGQQTPAFLAAQVEAVSVALDLGEDMTVLGHSLGGIVAAAFAEAHPSRVRRLVLVATGGLGHRIGHFEQFCRDVPIAGDWAFSVLGGMMLRRSAGPVLPPVPEIPDLPLRQAAGTRIRATLPAILSSLRHGMSVDIEPAHRRLGAAGLPVCAIWGREDRVIPIAAMGRLAQANRAAHQHVIEGAGHALPLTHARQLSETVAAFLREG